MQLILRQFTGHWSPEGITCDCLQHGGVASVVPLQDVFWERLIGMDIEIARSYFTPPPDVGPVRSSFYKDNPRGIRQLNGSHHKSY